VNENTNGLIRDFFPKGTDFSTIHPATVAKVERLLNRRSRKSLGFQTPNEALAMLVVRRSAVRVHDSGSVLHFGQQ
jgi:IS30 family transposase